MIRIQELRKLSVIDKVIIHSLDQCIYQASALIDGEEQMLADSKGKLLRSHNLLEMQTLFEMLPVERFVLRQQSAYDEMINQPIRQGANTLEVPLGHNGFGNANPSFQ